ncbi:uncharacterized protein LOC111066742 [Drosophila obscura]|uniref:uncharacterized protein LOC111066742 n=1 Tax=Drosophila obscura TaxID=7282 RepID=UPI001BB29514|nr:uncharacterized protein LOC111066742 [Drosophila obscura]
MNLLSPLLLLFIAGCAVAKVLPSNGDLSIDQHGQRVYKDQVEDDKCHYHCPERDPSVCSSNGQCLLKFESRCSMAAYNCRNPQKPFSIVEDHRCTKDWEPMCLESDLKEFGL